MRFDQLLENDFVILDGAMGTILQLKGLKAGELPELLGINQPDLIIGIHKSYIEAGANIIYANTFGANTYKMAGSGYSAGEIISHAVNNAKIAAQGTDALVGLDIGPTGKLLEPAGDLTFEEAYEIFKEQVIAGKDADVISIETMTDIHEAKAAVLAAKENSNLPVICTMSFGANLRTFLGCSISAMVLTLEGMGVDAIGVNCSLGPGEIFPIVEELSRWTSLPIVVKPNAGLPNPSTGTYDIKPKEFASYMKQLAKLGVKIWGGCCGTTPEYISALKEMLKNEHFVQVEKQIEPSVCTYTKTLTIDRPILIGESLNPTGREKLKEALINGDMEYVADLAMEQADEGAEIINVNAGLPEIDEKETLVNMITEIQSMVNVPLMIDSVEPEVIEAAARAYRGRLIINSVNGKDTSLDAILPIVKKYGALVVGLTLDEKGIPETAEERIEIAKKISERVIFYGIPRQNLIIDCLALPLSPGQDIKMETIETIKAIKMVKEQLHLTTILGISNVSYGLTDRGPVNASYLTMALDNGLDLPIININDENTMEAFRVNNE